MIAYMTEAGHFSPQTSYKAHKGCKIKDFFGAKDSVIQIVITTIFIEETFSRTCGFRKGPQIERLGDTLPRGQQK